MAKNTKTATGGEYLTELNPQGYINNREITNLPGRFLVKGSQNMFIKNSEKVVAAEGYQLLGAAKTVMGGCTSSYDWKTNTASKLSLRSYNAELEVFYNATKSFLRLKNGWTSTAFRYTTWWDSDELLDILLMVNGTTKKVWSWSGGMTKIASSTWGGSTGTITKQGYVTGSDISFLNNGVDGGGNTIPDTITKLSGGFLIAGFVVGDKIVITGSASNNITVLITTVTDTTLTLDVSDVLTTEPAGGAIILRWLNAGTWEEQRFFSQNGGDNSDRRVVIGTTELVYTSGETTGTIVVTTDPTALALSGTIVMQAIRPYTPSGLDNFSPTLISTVGNQVYYGSTNSRVVLISKNTDFTDFSETSPLRKVGDGAELDLDSCPTAFIPGQDDKAMYIGGGDDDIYQQTFVQTTTLDSNDVSLISETTPVKKFRTATGAAPQSQEAVVFIRNAVAFLSKEPTIDTLTHEANVVNSEAQALPISDPIKDDIEAYDLTGAHGIYFKRNLIYTLPGESKMIFFDMSNNNKYWQPPYTAPIGRLAIIEIDGVPTLCGHSSTCNETYTLLDGWNANGATMLKVAAFGYENYGDRFHAKVFDEMPVELYMTLSTIVHDRIFYDYKGATDIREFIIDPTEDPNIVFSPNITSALGSDALGQRVLGSTNDEIDPLAKIKVINMTTALDFYERQRVFFSDSKDARFEILAYAENTEMSENLPVFIKE